MSVHDSSQQEMNLLGQPTGMSRGKGRMEVIVKFISRNTVRAFAGKKVVGGASAWEDSRGEFVILNSEVREPYRRRGIATAMYQAIEEAAGKQLKPAVSLSDDAFEFWKSFRPESVAKDLRHRKEELMGAKAAKDGRVGSIISASGGIATIRFDDAAEGVPNSESCIHRDNLDESIATAGRLSQKSFEGPRYTDDAFDHWFQGSRVANEDGTPKRMYHGTSVWEAADGRSMGDFSVFDRMWATKVLRRKPGVDTVGSWFSDNPGEGGAGMYAGGAIYPVYLSIKKPWTVTFEGMVRTANRLMGREITTRLDGDAVERLRAWIVETGADGINIKHDDWAENGSTEFKNQDAWIALEPGQIKSSIGNIGAFDRSNDDIRFSVASDATSDDLEAVAGVVANMPSREFKARVLDNANTYASKGLVRLETDGYLAGAYKTKQRLDPIFVVPGDFSRAKFKDVVAEALAAGIMTDRVYVYGDSGSYSGQSINFTRFDSMPGLGAQSQVGQSVDQTRTAEFKDWFGSSVATETGGAGGMPLVLYHGTKADFTEFKRTNGGEFGPAIYLTDSAREAGEYGEGKGWGGPTGTSIMPVYVSIKNPYTKGVDAFWQEFGTGGTDAEGVAAAQAAGYDGIIAIRADRYYDNDAHEYVDRGGILTHYIAFNPEQIKSARGNSGQFSSLTPDIRFSVARSDLDNTLSGLAEKPLASKLIAALSSLGDIFRAMTGDNIEVAGTKLAGREVRNGMREQGVPAGATPTLTAEPFPYSEDAMAVHRRWESMLYPSSKYLFHTTPASNLFSIALSGLVTGSHQRFEGVSDGRISLAANEAVANYYGGANDVLLRVAKGFKLDGLEPDLLSGGDGAYLSAQNIPPEALEVMQAKKWIPIQEYTSNQPPAQSGHAQTATNTIANEAPAFREWFGDSMVVDAAGKPLVVYHGTKEDVSEFRSDFDDATAPGVYFTTDPRYASQYAGTSEFRSTQADGGSVVPAYLSIKNPMEVSPDDYWKAIRAEKENELVRKAITKGHDGVVVRQFQDNLGKADMWIAIHPEQIKSAIGNNGDFDPKNADVRFSRAPALEPIQTRAGTARQAPGMQIPSTVPLVTAAVSKLLGGMELGIGLGRVVVTTSAEIKETWEPILGKSLSFQSKGRARKVQGFQDPATNTVFLIADNIEQGSEEAIAAHEFMHKHGQNVLGADGWAHLHDVLNTWANASPGTQERAVYDQARAKVETIGLHLSSQELFPYAVESAFKMGIRPSLSARKGSVSSWLQSVKSSLQQVWSKIAGKPKTFNAQDLVDLSFGIAQMENPSSASKLAGALKPRIWRSSLQEGITTLATAAAPAAGWQAAIKGLVNKGIAKAAEVEWSGVTDWLELQAGKISKENLVDYLDSNGVKVTETILGGPDGDAQLVTLQDERDEQWEKTFGSRSWPMVIAGKSVRADELAYGLLDGDIPIHALPFDLQNGARNWVQAYQARMFPNIGDHPVPKFDKYQLPGGQNYRELLLTLPEKTTAEPARAAYEAWARQHGLQPNATHTESRYLKETGLEAPEPRTMTAMAADKEINFTSSHWDQRNVLAHVRVNERFDKAGKKTLFVEELQSDWGQLAKKHGFIGTRPGLSSHQNSAIRVRYAQLLKDKPALFKAITDINEIMLAMGTIEMREAFVGAGLPAVDIDAIHPTSGTVLPGPYVGNTQAWVSLAIKRVISYAAEHGFDQVAFINGRQSADRYSLSKEVDEVSYDATVNGGTLIASAKGAGPAHSPIIDRSDVTPAMLPEYVGKDVADRLLNNPTARDGTTTTVRGPDLVAGGEGMAKFYDEVVPSVVKDVLRKLGGGSLTTSTITIDNEGWHITPPGQTVSGLWMVKSSDYNSKGLQFDTEGEAKAALVERQTTSAQTSFDITPSMRVQAAAGLPLFSLATAAPQVFTAYHGTDAFVTEFDTAEVDQAGLRRLGSYFSASEKFASLYGSNVHSVQLEMKKPFDITGLNASDAIELLPVSARLKMELNSAFRGDDFSQYAMLETSSREGLRATLEAQGFDGIKYTEGHADAYIAFHPGQIKPGTVKPGGVIDSPGFKNWFLKSAVADAQGNPLTVFHGTKGDFSTFKLGEGNAESEAFFFADGKNVNGYVWSLLDASHEGPGDERCNVFMPVYLSVQNPKRLDTTGTGCWADPEYENEQIRLSKTEGFDGLIIEDSEHETLFYVAFAPEQIKSIFVNVNEFSQNLTDNREVQDARIPVDQTPPADAFQSWFGPSKVVNPDGTPRRVFHGTTADFNVFEKTHDIGFHFGTVEQANQIFSRKRNGRNIVPAYLSIRNPVRLLSDPRAWMAGYLVTHAIPTGVLSTDEIAELTAVAEIHLAAARAESQARCEATGEPRTPDAEWTKILRKHNAVALSQLRSVLEAKGYDGLVYTNRYEGKRSAKEDSWVAFRPSQIKSATGNSFEFNPNSTDIRFSLGAPVENTDEFMVGAAVTMTMMKEVIARVQGDISTPIEPIENSSSTIIQTRKRKP